MIVPLSVQNRFGIEKNESLILVPIKLGRFYEIIKDIAKIALCILAVGLPVYFNPSIFDQIYYSLLHHKKLIRIKKDPSDVSDLMNFNKFNSTLQSLGWTGPLTSVKNLYPNTKLDKDTQITKTLNQFSLALKQINQIIELPPHQNAAVIAESGTSSLNNNLSAYATSKGDKSAMEDLIHIESIQITVQNIKEDINCFILMDGHGVQKHQEPINSYAKKEFTKTLKQFLNIYLKNGFNFEATYLAFKDTFSAINSNYHYEKSGSTFIGIFFINHLVFCVSIGDSQCYFINSFQQLSLNLAADPDHPYFKRKLEKLGATIKRRDSIARVEGNLNMATAIGDKHIVNTSGKPVIKPSMSFIAIPQLWLTRPGYFILGSDGVFDLLNKKQIYDIIWSTSELKQKPQELIQKAYSLGSIDNLSTIVIKL